MKLRNLEGGLALDFSGHALRVTKHEATTLAVALANRALGRGVAPSLVDALRLSGSRDGLVVAVDVSDSQGLRTSLRVSGSARAWVALSVRLFADATGRDGVTIDEVLEDEFAEGGSA